MNPVKLVLVNSDSSQARAHFHSVQCHALLENRKMKLWDTINLILPRTPDLECLVIVVFAPTIFM